MYTFVYIYWGIHTCIVYIDVFTYIDTYIQTYIHVQTYEYIYIYVHTYTYIFIYAVCIKFNMSTFLHLFTKIE